MAEELQTILAGAAALLTATGVVIGGIYTGQNARKKEAAELTAATEAARIMREQAQEVASAHRVEQLAQDATLARQALREADEANRDIRYDRQRGWDLARYHFGLMSFLAHLINNVTLVGETASAEDTQEIVRTVAIRMKTVRIPLSLEDPIPDRRAPAPKPPEVGS
jgi:hypothetical protein